MATEDKRIKNLPCNCKDCDYNWEEAFMLPETVPVVAFKMKNLRCPKCGSKEVYFVFGSKPKCQV